MFFKSFNTLLSFQSYLFDFSQIEIETETEAESHHPAESELENNEFIMALKSSQAGSITIRCIVL